MAGFRIAGGAGVLALAAAIWAPVLADMTGPVHLACRIAGGVPAAPARQMCDALAGQLGQILPDRTLLRGGDAPGDALALVLTVTEVLPQQITAHLTWRDGAARGATPALALSVEDKGLTSRSYDRLARALVAKTGIDR